MTYNPNTPSGIKRKQQAMLSAQRNTTKAAVRKALKSAKVPSVPTSKVKKSKPIPKSSSSTGGLVILMLGYLLTKKWFWITMFVVVFFLWLFK